MNRILVTRPRAQADEFVTSLVSAGFTPILFPVIEIQKSAEDTELENALSNLERYDWVIFTSANAVKVVWEQMRKQGIDCFPKNVRVAAIGPKTAKTLAACGIVPAFIPAEYVAEAILPGLGDLSGRRVLLPRAEIARKALPEAIALAGGAAHEITVYRTLPAQADLEGLAALKAGVDWVTFTSPSTVQNFIEILRANGLDPLRLPAAPRIACIGPITEKAARKAGFAVAVVAKNYTTEGLIDAIRNG